MSARSSHALNLAEAVILLAHAALLSVILAPVFLNLAPPFLDYHNHMARAYVIQNLTEFEGVYAVHWRIAPYIFSDLAFQVFASFFEIYDAAKYFLSACFLLMVGGVVLISRKLHGRISAATLLVYFFLFNTATILGLVNYLFGLGVALLSFYVWLCARGRRFQWGALTLVFLVNFLVHAISFGCLGLLIALYECWPLRRYFRAALQRAGIVLACAAPSFALLAIAPAATVTGGSTWPDAQSMMLALTAPVALAGEPELMLLILMLPVLWGVGILKIRQGFGVPVLAMVVISAALPHTLMGIVFFGIRLPVFIALLACAIGTISGRQRVMTAAVLGIFMLLGLYNYGALSKMIDDCGQKHAAFVAQLRAIELEPRHAMQVVNRSADICEMGGDVFYFAHAAVIEKKMLIPFLYTHVLPPISPVGAYAPLLMTDVQAIAYEPFMKQSRAEQGLYRYIMVFDDHGRDDFPRRDAWRVGGGDFFTVYENRHYQAVAKDDTQ